MAKICPVQKEMKKTMDSYEKGNLVRGKKKIKKKKKALIIAFGNVEKLGKKLAKKVVKKEK